MKKIFASLAAAALLVFGGVAHAGGNGKACEPHGKAGQHGQGATHGKAGQAHGKKCETHGKSEEHGKKDKGEKGEHGKKDKHAHAGDDGADD